jgi:hypothetical protein
MGICAGALALVDEEALPVEANTERSRREPTCPCGQSIGSDASAIGRRASNVVSHSGQRNS